MTQEEDDEIRNNAANYIPEIAEVLNSIPREMLLILKTNDLLRGIEGTLHCRANASSLLTMSKCCIEAVYQQQARSCPSWWGLVRLKIVKHIALVKISVYEFYLWAVSTLRARNVLLL